jgi:hypothetical protein
VHSCRLAAHSRSTTTTLLMMTLVMWLSLQSINVAYGSGIGERAVAQNFCRVDCFMTTLEFLKIKVCNKCN